MQKSSKSLACTTYTLHIYTFSSATEPFSNTFQCPQSTHTDCSILVQAKFSVAHKYDGENVFPFSILHYNYSLHAYR